MNISFNTMVKVKLTEKGIEKYLEYVDDTTEKFKDKYQLTDIECLSFRQNLESHLKNGNELIEQISSISSIFADDSFENNYHQYIIDGMMESLPGELGLYNEERRPINVRVNRSTRTE